MTALVALRAGAQTTIVDRGRFGFRDRGIGCGGALDALAYAAGNILVRNVPGAAALEIPFGNASFRFEGRARFALMGADCDAMLDGVRADAWSSHEAQSGSTLTLGFPRSQVRAYLTIAGGIDVPIVLASRTTDLAGAFGGFNGRALRDGDSIPIGEPSESPGAPCRRCEPPPQDSRLRLLPGGCYSTLSNGQRARLYGDPFSISPNSNRMGVRLNAEPPLDFSLPEQRSSGVFPGVVQIPPSGEPIVLLADAQTTGGYPALGAVVESDLWKIAQLPAGATVRFVPCTYAEAREARDEIASYLLRVSELR